MGGEVNLSHLYTYECDSMRLLIDELEKQFNEYNSRNSQHITNLEAYDRNEYHPPSYISNYKAILASSILIQAQGLLDFLLPRIVDNRSKLDHIAISKFDKSWKKGNVLCWIKHVLKNELSLEHDFSRGPYSKLRDFYEFRNDNTHNGGYVSSDINRLRLNENRGIDACKYTDLYVVDFSYCRSVIDSIESFFGEIHNEMNV